MKHLFGPGTGGADFRLLLRRLGTALLPVALSIGLGTVPLCKAQAQDGAAALKKMIAAYQNLTTYEGHATTDDMWLTEQGQTVKLSSSSVMMQYRKPNKLKLSITTPLGDHDVYSDG